MATEASFDVRAMSRADVPAYLEFARRAYGTHAYQSQARYVRWLYESAGSATRGYGDAVVAVHGEHVVGCIHKSRYPVLVDGELRTLACPHNLMVSEPYRRGAGLALILESFRDEQHVFLMGVTPPVTTLYDRLRCTRLTSYWHRAVLNPLTAPVAAALDRVAPGQRARVVDIVARAALRTSSALGIPAVHASELVPSSVLADALGAADVGGVRMHWDTASVEHRFASDDGPRHLVFGCGRRARGDAHEPICVVSIGLRRGLVAARIVEANGSRRELVQMLGRLRFALALAGVNVVLAYTTSERQSSLFASAGLTAQAQPPVSYLRHRDRSALWTDVRFQGGAGDFGFEAIRPD